MSHDAPLPTYSRQLNPQGVLVSHDPPPPTYTGQLHPQGALMWESHVAPLPQERVVRQAAFTNHRSHRSNRYINNIDLTRRARAGGLGGRRPPSEWGTRPLKGGGDREASALLG